MALHTKQEVKSIVGIVTESLIQGVGFNNKIHTIKLDSFPGGSILIPCKSRINVGETLKLYFQYGFNESQFNNNGHLSYGACCYEILSEGKVVFQFANLATHL